MTTTNAIVMTDDFIARLDRQYGHSPFYLIGQIEAIASDKGFGTPTQRLVRINRAIVAWEKAHQEHEQTCS